MTSDHSSAVISMPENQVLEEDLSPLREKRIDKPLKLLIVEDEQSVRDMLKFALSEGEFEVQEAIDASQALEMIKSDLPNLILLDWMMPGMSGLDLTRILKKDAVQRKVPIILLTARAEEDDKVLGLDAGADDYVIKPFSTRELRSRIMAVLRRSGQLIPGEMIEHRDLCLDPKGHKVTIGGEPLDMGPTEFKILHFFMTHPDRAYSREQLLNNIWGRNVYIEERTIDVHIRRLRKILTPSGFDKTIQTVRTVGYRFSFKAIAE